eukprot:TRINITY_DN30039_c0_g1_i1.p1 TRINITY_DN30039_c0_g1~~TRINITY_DN30039_c0_g1_i1.p1  ORF type:complete len:122 (-),score=13.94 TRINITY_DN30039_c0_g1_i1:32-397(-)
MLMPAREHLDGTWQLVSLTAMQIKTKACTIHQHTSLLDRTSSHALVWNALMAFHTDRPSDSFQRLAAVYLKVNNRCKEKDDAADIQARVRKIVERIILTEGWASTVSQGKTLHTWSKKIGV